MFSLGPIKAASVTTTVSQLVRWLADILVVVSTATEKAEPQSIRVSDFTTKFLYSQNNLAISAIA